LRALLIKVFDDLAKKEGHMKRQFQTEQEEFWASEFGDSYIERNNSDQLLASKTVFWGNLLRSAHGVCSIKEFGCNIGLNLLALKKLRPNLELAGVEINEKAAEQAKSLDVAEIEVGSIIEECTEERTYDLTFTAGVLIHINPNMLEHVYRNLYNQSKRYILVAEYYNPSPVSINYRGNDERLFKRDFAGELIDTFGMKLVDYGFVYRRDNWAPQDDMTWFLLEK